MIKLYSSLETHDTYLELWNASTKHPDSVFCFSDFKKNEFLEPETQIFQWILECASKLTWPFYAKELAEFALNNCYMW